MRELREVTIAHAVIHLVAARQNRLVLSEAELPQDQEVFDFLAAHAEGGLRDSQAKAVEFLVKGEDRVQGLCDQILQDDKALITASQSLARLLYGVTEKDKRISDGALAVLICQAASPTNVRFLSLLKLDPAKGYKPIEESDSNGKTIVKLEKEDDILPSQRERLQKAAFIRRRAPKLEYRALAVDRQTTAEPAQFFVSNFLGAEYVFDTAERTERLYRSLRGARNDVEGKLPATQLVALDKVIEGTMASSSVNLDEVVASLPVPNEIRDEIDQKVSQVLPDRQFELDKTLGARLVQKRRYEADNDVRVIVPAEFYDQMITVEDLPQSASKRRRVTILTDKWEEW